MLTIALKTLDCTIHVDFVNNTLVFTGVTGASNEVFSIDQSIIDALAPRLIGISDTTFELEMDVLQSPVTIMVGRTVKWVYVMRSKRVVVNIIDVDPVSKSYAIHGTFRRSALSEEEWLTDEYSIPDAVIARVVSAVQ